MIAVTTTVIAIVMATTIWVAVIIMAMIIRVAATITTTTADTSRLTIKLLEGPARAAGPFLHAWLKSLGGVRGSQPAGMIFGGRRRRMPTLPSNRSR